jgi:signal peptidase II
MKAEKMVRNVLIILVLLGNVGCDQLTKNMVREKIKYNEKITVIDHFITLTKVENTGAFLSLGNRMPRILYKFLMIILPLIVLGYALFYLFRNTSLPKLLVVGICLLAGGGLGNIFDRILYGSVTDFLHFDFVIFQTGIVNMADISITAGFFVCVYYFYIKKDFLKPKTTV